MRRLLFFALSSVVLGQTPVFGMNQEGSDLLIPNGQMAIAMPPVSSTSPLSSNWVFSDDMMKMPTMMHRPLRSHPLTIPQKHHPQGFAPQGKR